MIFFSWNKLPDGFVVFRRRSHRSVSPIGGAHHYTKLSLLITLRYILPVLLANWESGIHNTEHWGSFVSARLFIEPERKKKEINSLEVRKEVRAGRTLNS